MTTALTITDRVAEMHAAMAAQPPNEVMGAFGREQAELAAAGLPAGIATVGTVVADTDLLDPHGAPTTLYAATGGATAVLVFYRGAWCPYCNIALSTYQAQLLPAADRTRRHPGRGQPAGTGRVAEHDREERPHLPVVSDPGNTIAGQLGILTAPSPRPARRSSSSGWT